jgi:hypothetical protein
MADEHKPKEPRTKGGVLSAAGKAKGAAAAPKASPAEVAQPVATPPHTLSTKTPKLQKKNKSRLPRRQKKAHEKLATAQAGGPSGKGTGILSR